MLALDVGRCWLRCWHNAGIDVGVVVDLDIDIDVGVGVGIYFFHKYGLECLHKC